MSAPTNSPSTNPDLIQPTSTYPPSHAAAPTKVDTAPQQGSTSPEDGYKVHSQNTSGEDVPFKERVIGVAQKTRGTLFGNQELKDHGEAILEGRTTHEQEVQEGRHPE